MDVLSAAISLKVDVDLQFTVSAANLYRMLAQTIAHGHEKRTLRTLFRKFIHAAAEVAIDEAHITVSFGRRANNPFLAKNGFAGKECTIPWFVNRTTRPSFEK